MIFSNDILPPERRGLITGSEVHVLFPKRSAEVGQRNYAKKLANELFWQYSDNASTWQMEHGNMNEHLAAAHYARYYFTQTEKPDFIVDKVNQLGGSPDAIANGHGLDWKCPTSLAAWLDYLHEGISDQQFYQCQMYMHLTGLKEWYIAAFLTETLKMIDSGVEYPVPDEQRMILIHVPYREGFSELLLERTPAIIKMRDEFHRTLLNTFVGRESTEQERIEKEQFDIERNPEFFNQIA